MRVAESETSGQPTIVTVHRDEIATQPRASFFYRLACVYLTPMFDIDALPALYTFHADKDQLEEFSEHVGFAWHTKDWRVYIDQGDGKDAFGYAVKTYPDDDPTSRGLCDPQPRKPGELKEILAKAKQGLRALDALFEPTDVVRSKP
jgi:hypothetical protein